MGAQRGAVRPAAGLRPASEAGGFGVGRRGLRGLLAALRTPPEFVALPLGLRAPAAFVGQLGLEGRLRPLGQLQVHPRLLRPPRLLYQPVGALLLVFSDGLVSGLEPVRTSGISDKTSERKTADGVLTDAEDPDRLRRLAALARERISGVSPGVSPNIGAPAQEHTAEAPDPRCGAGRAPAPPSAALRPGPFFAARRPDLADLADLVENLARGSHRGGAGVCGRPTREQSAERGAAERGAAEHFRTKRRAPGDRAPRDRWRPLAFGKQAPRKGSLG